MNIKSTILAAVVVFLGTACPPAPPAQSSTTPKRNDGQEAPEKREKPKLRPIEDDRIIRALEGENAALRKALGDRPMLDATYTGLINAHEHLKARRDLERYLAAARTSGVAMTVVVASPEFTIMGKGNQGEPGMAENLRELLAIQRDFPSELLVFATLDPKDKDKLTRLKQHVADGARGLKLYSGHSNFYDGNIAKSDMDPVLAYLEETGLPVNWHINLMKFGGEFEAVMTKYPKLNVMVPHYGVAFWRQSGVEKLAAIMRKHPNVLVDTSLGTREILINGMTAIEPQREQFVAFFEEFQDRIVWGTDSVITGNPEKTPGWYHKVIWATREHLEKDVFTTELAAGYSRYFEKGRDAEGRYLGLALKPEVLKKVYVDNAKRWLKL